MATRDQVHEQVYRGSDSNPPPSPNDHRPTQDNTERQRAPGPRQLGCWDLISPSGRGMVGEDYSADGEAWDYFSHDQAAHAPTSGARTDWATSATRTRSVFAPGLLDGLRRLLKERAFGLTAAAATAARTSGCSVDLDATPSHGWLRYLYKYPAHPPLSGTDRRERAPRARRRALRPARHRVFDDDRYWDVEVLYAKASPPASIAGSTRETVLRNLPRSMSCRRSGSETPGLGDRHSSVLAGRPAGRPLGGWGGAPGAPPAPITSMAPSHRAPLHENESNVARLFGGPNPSPFVKDAFHRHLVDGEPEP